MISNSQSTKKYLIDSNSFITPSNNYYPMDMVKSFWDDLNNSTISKNLYILDKVVDELCLEKDDNLKSELQKWIENSSNFQEVKSGNVNIVKNYMEVLEYLRTSDYYKETAVAQWGDIKIADPWLIAASMEYGYTIVTFEKSNNLNINAKVKYAKIPNVCDYFNVSYCTLFDMMRDLSFEY